MLQTNNFIFLHVYEQRFYRQDLPQGNMSRRTNISSQAATRYNYLDLLVRASRHSLSEFVPVWFKSNQILVLELRVLLFSVMNCLTAAFREVRQDHRELQSNLEKVRCALCFLCSMREKRLDKTGRVL